LLETRRRELHRAVGEALEQLHEGAPEEVYGLLARHYSEADDPARAADYLLKAGDLARGLYAEDEAIELYRRALGFMGRTSDEPAARETLLKIALTHHLAFDFEQASRVYQQAFARPPSPFQRLEPAEVIETSYLRSIPFAYVPGIGFDDVASHLARHLYRGLVTIGRELEILPDIAKAFDVAPDGLTYRFRLRSDALWTDGAPVTAGDFLFGWERMREAGFASSALHVDVASTEALDAHTLEISLHEPRSHFLYLLGNPTLFPWPRHAYEALGPSWYERVPLIGNGPFLLAELRQDEIVMVANEKWHGPRGNVKAIRAELFPGTDQQRLGRWVAGRYDALFGARLDVPLRDETSIVEPTSQLSTMYLAFRADRPPFDSPLVRRAFAHGIDRERLVAAADFVEDHAGRGGFLPPAMPGHSHRVAPGYEPERARQLLEEAGFLDNVTHDGIMIATAEALGPALRAELDRQLADVGVRAEVRVVPFRDMQSTVEELADAWVWGWIADFPDPDAMFTGFLANHPTVYQDARFLRCIEEARSIFDRDQRLHAYREAEQSWIGEDVALIPLAYGRQLTLRRPWLHGVWANAFATSTFAEAVVHRSVVRPQKSTAAT